MVMFPDRFFPKMMTVSFLGMAGIGKTSLVKDMFEDSSILCHFNHHVWVELGPEYESEEILVDILVQIYPNIDKKQIKGNEDLGKSLCAELLDKKCLIVLDDVWSKKPLDYIKYSFPDFKGTILVTTRLAKVAHTRKDDILCRMRLLNKDESWDLFCENVFGEETCPSHLKKAGEKIVENCEGLPLMIVTVADIVSKVEKTVERWNDVAQKNSSIFMDAYDQISKKLVPSYVYLPQYLKMCFLYIGIFPQNKVIHTSKLVKFWIAEGFLEPNVGQRIEDFAADCLSELDNRSLVVVSQKGSSFRIKTCSLHCVFWHFSNSVAVKNKFFHALSTFSDSKVEGMKGQRRLCIRNSTLLGIKDVQDSIASISAARSLLCAAPSHQYPVRVCFDLRLLRLMDALSIRLYEFPIKVVELYYLRYLALTSSGNLPPSISKLWNLQFLIVGRHLNIKSSTDSSNLPMEIWDMEELQHLQVEGSNLPNPNHGVVLRNLSTLVGVSAQSCTRKVLKGVPNLKRLGIQIELEPDENGNNPFRFLNRISRLRGLESLKCVVANPDFTSEIISPPMPRSMFPSSLKKLSLSGLGYPWEYMKIISKLENLEVLKLQCYAFQGTEWKIEDSGFEALQFLLIEDTDLVRWKFTTAGLVHLKCLCIKHCYQLEELPRDLHGFVQTVEVIDCNPFVENWAKELEHDVRNFQNISSWDARKLER